MNLLSRTANIYRQNVGHLLFVSSSVTSAFGKRSLNTNEWRKYLTILDVNKDSTPKDIKDSFLKLSKVYHPDNKATGSHMKFVELKEAYDALKDGHPTITTTGPSRTNNYNNYYDTDVSYQAHRAYREQYKDYRTAYEHRTYGFGGPYKNSSKPWEEMAREREYRRQQAYNNSFGNRARPLVSLTIILSAMAWIVIYSCVLLIWDYNDAFKKGMSSYKAKTHQDYEAYQEYIRRKEAIRKNLRREKEAAVNSVNKVDESGVRSTQFPDAPLTAPSPLPIDVTLSPT